MNAFAGRIWRFREDAEGKRLINIPVSKMGAALWMEWLLVWYRGVNCKGMRIIAVVGRCLSNVFIQQGWGQSLGGVGVLWGKAVGAPR